MKPSYHTASIRELKKLFASLPVPEQAMRDGFFRASFIGPAWYRISGFPSVHVAGLPYWQGKKFLTPVSATNILRKNNDFVEALVMTVEEGISMIDGKLGVALRYGAEAPIRWCWVRDEIRAVDDRTLLGITIVDIPVLRHFCFPFLLVRES